MRFSCNLLKREMEDYEGTKYNSSDRLMETVRRLGFEQRYKVCVAFGAKAVLTCFDGVRSCEVDR